MNTLPPPADVPTITIPRRAAPLWSIRTVEIAQLLALASLLLAFGSGLSTAVKAEHRLEMAARV